VAQVQAPVLPKKEKKRKKEMFHTNFTHLLERSQDVYEVVILLIMRR
jgi:hypothetical protein